MEGSHGHPKALTRLKPTANHARLTECGQFHQIIFRHRLDGFSGFAPGGEAADDHKRVEPFFPQQMRHTGAGGLACSSAVQVDVFVFGKVFDFVLKIVGLNSNRVLNSSRTGIVIAVAPHVDDLHSIGIL